MRTKDEVSYASTDRLFKRASNPRDMLRLRETTVAKLIYPAGFYRVKAKQIRKICRMLIDRWAGKVPKTIDELVELPGVGRVGVHAVAVGAGHAAGVVGRAIPEELAAAVMTGLAHRGLFVLAEVGHPGLVAVGIVDVLAARPVAGFAAALGELGEAGFAMLGGGELLLIAVMTFDAHVATHVRGVLVRLRGAVGDARS